MNRFSALFLRASRADSRTRARWFVSAIAICFFAVLPARLGASPTYDDGAGNGCVECHHNGSAGGGFTGGSSTGLLHFEHQNKFGLTSCTLCHQNGGGDTPVRTYFSGDGYGCAGCHGNDYAETSVLSGQPKASGYGLRASHALAGVTVCAACHFPGSEETGEPDPAPAILPENNPPPYYGLATTNLDDACSTAQESFDGTLGLDNDGNGLADMDDPACQAVTPPCAALPLVGCLVPGKASMKVRDSIDNSKDVIKWKWSKGPQLDQIDLGNPDTTTAYTLCVYDSMSGVDSLVGVLQVDPSTTWVNKDPKGWSYKDTTAADDGVQKVLLNTGGAGKSRVQISAKGATIPMPSPLSGIEYFDQDPRVTAQLVNNETLVCFTSQFTAATKNNGNQFKDKMP